MFLICKKKNIENVEAGLDSFRAIIASLKGL
jgi:hypothetical protein